MRVALVAHVEHQFVLRRIEHIVQRHSGLDKTKVRPHVSTVLAHAVEHGVARFVGHNLQCFDVQPLQVGWRLNLFYVHGCGKV